MKKFFLSLSVIILFIFYSQIQHQTGGGTPAAPTVLPSPQPNNSSANSNQTISYKDGQYTGKVVDAYYGNIQVMAIIQNGKITDVQFLQYPNDRERSIAINSQAMPILKQEAIQAQNAKVDIVSGATDSSQAFIDSLGSALSQAQ